MKVENRKRSIRSRSNKFKLNKEIRRSCCWNCFQTGHLRFQCPFPKVEVCSFCRHPGIRSSECNCPEARAHFNVSDKFANEEHIRNSVLPYQLNVVVPVNAHCEQPQYVEKDNLVVFVENNQSIEDDEVITELCDEEDADVIELFAEEDDLSQI